MFDHIFRQYRGTREIYLVVLAAVLGIYALVYFWLLTFFGVPDERGRSVFSSLSVFLKLRLSGAPLSFGEIISFFVAAVVLAVPVLLFLFLFRNLKRKNLMKRYANKQGTAEWAKEKEISKLLGNTGVAVGYQKKILKPIPVRFNLRSSCEHVAVIGPTGCGKTSVYFIYNLLTLPEGASAVVTDPKGEIERTTKNTLRSRGWQTVAFNINNPESAVYNPLAIAVDETEISEIADITLRNGYSSAGQSSDAQWVNLSASLWESLLLAAMEMKLEKGYGADIPTALSLITKYDDKKLLEIMSNVGGQAWEKHKMYLQSAKSPETMASIKTVLTSSLRLFSRPDVRRVISDTLENGEPIHPEHLRKSPTVFYIQVPERKSELLKPLMATMFWQLLEHIIDLDGCPVFFFLDEFPNIGKINSFAQMAATVRSRKISISIGLQGIEQLSREYSKEEQSDIINNMKTKIIYPGSSGESPEYLTRILGYSTIKSKDGNHERRELLTPDEVRRIPDGKLLVLAHNLNPILLEAVPYYQLPDFAAFKQKF